jgi:hypothetical protein
LLAGDVVLLGSLVQTQWVQAGDVVTIANDPAQRGGRGVRNLTGTGHDHGSGLGGPKRATGLSQQTARSHASPKPRRVRPAICRAYG